MESLHLVFVFSTWNLKLNFWSNFRTFRILDLKKYIFMYRVSQKRMTKVLDLKRLTIITMSFLWLWKWVMSCQASGANIPITSIVYAGIAGCIQGWKHMSSFFVDTLYISHLVWSRELYSFPIWRQPIWGQSKKSRLIGWRSTLPQRLH